MAHHLKKPMNLDVTESREQNNTSVSVTSLLRKPLLSAIRDQSQSANQAQEPNNIIRFKSSLLHLKSTFSFTVIYSLHTNYNYYTDPTIIK